MLLEDLPEGVCGGDGGESISHLQSFLMDYIQWQFVANSNLRQFGKGSGFGRNSAVGLVVGGGIEAGARASLRP